MLASYNGILQEVPVEDSHFIKFDVENCAYKINKIDIFLKDEWIESSDMERLNLLEKKSEFIFYDIENRYCIIHCPKTKNFQNLIFIIHLNNGSYIFQRTYMITRSGLENYQKEQIIFNNLKELISHLFFGMRYKKSINNNEEKYDENNNISICINEINNINNYVQGSDKIYVLNVEKDLVKFTNVEFCTYDYLNNCYSIETNEHLKSCDFEIKENNKMKKQNMKKRIMRIFGFLFFIFMIYESFRNFIIFVEKLKTIK